MLGSIGDFYLLREFQACKHDAQAMNLRIV
jgi:hypothetical protein